MDIKDYLGQYVKSTSLKLGGESAIAAISDGAQLVGIESSIKQPTDWFEDQVVLEQTEGNRLVIKGKGNDPVNIYGGTLNLGLLPEDGGGNSGANVTNLFGNNQINLVSEQIDISSQSNSGYLTLRAGSSASAFGIALQSSAVGVGELKILLLDANGDAGLPTGTASLVPNQLWNDNGTLKIYTP